MSCVVQMLTSLQHPCIAPILLFHSTDLGCVKVQSLAARGSLRDVLHASKQQSSDACALLSRESIVNISLQILRGLQFLHSKGLCHGHLHTGNILISPSGNIQLSDVDNYPLGLSSFYRPHFIHHRAVCSTLETIDVFCFGLVLWELCKRGSNNDISCSKNRSHSCDATCTDPSSYCDILPSVLPDYLDLDLRALLESILSPRALQSSLPSVQVLLNQALFQGYVLPDYNNNNNSNRTSIKLSSSMKKYLSHMREKTLTRLAVDHKQFRHEKRLYRMESMIRADSDVSQYVIERSPSLCNTRTSEPTPPGLGHASPAEHTPTSLSFSSQPSTPSGGVSERTPLNQPSPMSESEHTPQSSSSAHSDSVSQSLPPVGMNRGALLSSIQCFQ
uniref:PX domain-containing protein kinase-like protein n=1 Tax=Cacopsylla melanoneura TaxID=428564 RepID=A0A8D8MC35_9HEMI